MSLRHHPSQPCLIAARLVGIWSMMAPFLPVSSLCGIPLAWLKKISLSNQIPFFGIWHWETESPSHHLRWNLKAIRQTRSIKCERTSKIRRKAVNRNRRRKQIFRDEQKHQERGSWASGDRATNCSYLASFSRSHCGDFLGEPWELGLLTKTCTVPSYFLPNLVVEPAWVCLSSLHLEELWLTYLYAEWVQSQELGMEMEECWGNRSSTGGWTLARKNWGDLAA